MVNTSPTSDRITPPKRVPTWRDHVWTVVKYAVLLAFLAYLWSSFIATEFNLYTLWDAFQPVPVVDAEGNATFDEAGQRITTPPRFLTVMSDITHPDFSWYIYDADGQLVLHPKTGKPKLNTLPKLLISMNETVQISLLGTLIAVLLSFPLAFAASKNLTKGTRLGLVLYGTTRFIFNITRAFPPFILAIILVIMVGPGPFPGVLALGLHSIGMLGKLFSEAIEGVDPAPVEAVRATGASNFLIVWYGILPQVVPQFLAYSLYRWDINIRMSIILGIVGAGGIGFLLDQYIRQFQYSQASTCFLIILVAVTVLDYASAYFRERLG